MGFWSPATWNDVGVVAIVILMALGIAFAFVRGWLVLGRHHTEVVASYKDSAAKDAATIEAQANTIELQARTMSEWNVAGQLQAHMLQSVRDVLERR